MKTVRLEFDAGSGEWYPYGIEEIEEGDYVPAEIAIALRDACRLVLLHLKGDDIDGTWIETVDTIEAAMILAGEFPLA